MQQLICITCGTRYPKSDGPPAGCPICEDDRQYVGHGGQQWTTLAELRESHQNTFTELAPGITAIKTEPRFGINQQAHLIQTGAGNVLWDCIALIDEATVSGVNELGGIDAIALSHPHYYTTINEWSKTFGDVPIYIHADDREWVMEPGETIEFWQGETLEILPGSGTTLIRCGGHFPGAAVLHWSDGNGALFSGDTIQVVADQRWVSFMYSYPNIVPLNAAEVQRIVDAVDPFPFETIYGAFGGIVREDGHGAVHRSAERYIRAIGGD